MKRNEELTFDIWSCILGADVPRAPFQHAEPRKQKGKEYKKVSKINKTKMKRNEMKWRTNLDLWSCILGADVPRAPFRLAEPRKQKEKGKRRLVRLMKQKKQNETKKN